MEMAEERLYKISKVSEITGLAPYVLRFWEGMFPSLRPRKTPGNQRVYSDTDIALILKIKALLYQERLTIDGAKRRLLEENRAPTPSGNYGSLLKEIRQQLREIVRTLA